MLIREKDKLLDAISKIYEDKVDPSNIVLVGTFIDINQEPIDAVRDEDAVIRFIYIDEGSTLLLIKYHNTESRNLIENGLGRVRKHLQVQGYKIILLYESSDSIEKKHGEFVLSFCR